MVRIAVLGCGRIGRMHAANIANHPTAELAAIYDIQTAAAKDIAEKLNASVADSAKAIFIDPSIDAVLIATATPTHADYIEAAVKAGKPVLCEKPIDLSLERVNSCMKAIAGSSVPVQIGFNRRFDPGHKAARNAVIAGEIGDLHQVIITSRDPGMPHRNYWLEAGGIFRDMVIHDFDLARFMLREEPIEVFSIGGRLIDPNLMEELQDYDSTMTIMRTATGRQCHINTSRASNYGYDQRVELLGDKGMVQSQNKKPYELRKFGSTAVESTSLYLEFFIERYKEAFNEELNAFINSVEKNEPVPVNFEDGRRALILAEAAIKSAVEGRFIKIDEVN
ncbi:MAG: inositol 2-dehydrogenase [Tateyamaria sp.]|jgi:myo-inositol 2-dehydrogenase/D-chiro-inositol 1-dehydrogenase|nr:inositol 2-dehydrogenase [Tateyamaria sp.]